jgi:pyridoxamine 5'-phosphate oxidase
MSAELPRHLPPFYNDLMASHAEAWSILSRGAVDRRSAMHTVTVATVGLNGAPRIRTVVLRHVSVPDRTLRFHTDARSGKIAELRHNPQVQIAACDPGQKIQLRITGLATIHQRDEVAVAAWDRAQIKSRECYRQIEAPGTAASRPEDLTRPAEHDGVANFSAVRVAIEEIDWLYLAASGHRRARFRWPDGALAATWLAP